ncbi:hypothetical protein Tco_1549274 [Tanacetum coccineum]
MSDMTTCLNDFSYIPPNNKQNEPTKGDIGETSNEPTQAIRNEFEELYASTNEELYPGCDYVTRLDFMAKFTHFKVKGKLVDSIFNEMLEFFQFLFPLSKGYKLPPSYYAIKKTFKMIRWKDNNTTGKKVPKKESVRIQYMQHPLLVEHGRSLTLGVHFAAEPRNVRLGLAVDGFNPFGNLTQSYNMWPVILTTYNLPSWLCMKESYLMLTLLILGPKSPGKDIDVYLRHLINDLKDLWALKGVDTIDVATGQNFNMRAMVLWTINDFPARISLSGWSGKGYMACHTCNEDTPSMRVRSRDFNGETEDGDLLRKFNWAQIHTQLDKLPTREKGKHPSYGGVKIKLNVLVEMNWTKRSIFYELEYWSFLTLKHNLDVMHIKNSWKYFKHTLKHLKRELTLVELGSHLRIEESLRMQDSDKPKGNNVAGPSVVNMREWRGDDGVGCGGTTAGEEGEGKTRVRASEYDERVDRAKRSTFGFGRNARRKTFPAAATWWPAAAGWPAVGCRKGEGESVESVCVCL